MKINFHPQISSKSNLINDKNNQNVTKTPSNNNPSENLSNIYYRPLTFGCKQYESDNFKQELSNLEGIHCPISGVKMLTKKELKEIINESKNITKASELVELMGKHEENLLPMFKKMHSYSKMIVDKDPELSSQGLINLLRSGATSLVRKNLAQVRLELREHQRDESLSISDREKIRECRHRILEIEEDPKLRILSYNKYKNILRETIGNLDTDRKSKIYYEAKEPVKNISLYQYVTIHTMQDKENGISQPEKLIENLFSGSLTNVSKIIVGSDLNLNERDTNQILVCKQASDNYEFVSGKLLNNPNAKQNLDTYLDEISKAILDNKLQSNVRYPNSLYVFLKKLSKNDLQLDKSNAMLSLSAINHRAQLKEINFEIVNQKDVPCASCGNTTITHDQKCEVFAEIERASDLQDIKNIMLKNTKYIKQKYKNFLNEYTKLIDNNRDLPEKEVLSKMRKIYHDKTINEVLSTSQKVEQISKRIGLNRDEKDLVKQFVAECKKTSANRPDNTCFSYDEYNSMISKTIAKIPPEKREQLIYVAKHKVCEAFILENLLYPHKNALAKVDMPFKIIMQDVIRTSTATIKRLDPLDCGGSNERKNLVVYCSDCSGEKSNKKLSSWQKSNPKLEENYKKYLHKVNELNNSGQINGYDDYVSDSVDFVYELSNGKINVDKSDFE